MEFLYALALGLGILLLVGLNLAVWSWAWTVFAEARRDRRDKALLMKVVEQQALIRQQRKTIAAQHAELRVLHGKAGAITAQLNGRA